MKLTLIFFAVLTSLSLWVASQETPPVVCRGKPLSVTMLEKPGVEMRVPPIPIRFGGTRYGPIWQVLGDNDDPFRLVIKNRDQFTDFWKRFTKPSGWLPPIPEVDFSKEMIVVVGLGLRPPCCSIMIDGACEVDGRVELFISKVEDGPCSGAVLGIMTAPADVVRIPRSDLPIVFREIQVPCVKWHEHLMRLSRNQRD